MIGCRGLCGAELKDEDAATKAGWSYLQITAGWRCGSCDRELFAASKLVGINGTSSEDLIPSTSRGALPKETASTILPPSVKG